MERTPPRGEAAGKGDTATTPRGGRFRYRLVDLAGDEVGQIARERPLRADDVVATRAAHEAAWRVVGVLGTLATVVPARDESAHSAAAAAARRAWAGGEALTLEPD